MRTRATLLTILAMLATAPAVAAVLPVTATLQIAIGTTLPPVVAVGMGTVVADRPGSSGPFTAIGLSSAVVATTSQILPVTDPSAAPIRGLMFTVANGPGTFTEDGGPLARFGGVMPLDGVAKVCLFGSCTAAVSNLVIPLSVVGVGGAAVMTAAVNLTVLGAPWTTGTVQIGSLTAMGGFDAANPIRQQVSLVTPVFVSTNIAASAVVPTMVYLGLDIAVPEPATALMLGGGVALLVAIGRRARA